MPTNRRLKYLLSSFDGEMLYAAAKHGLQEHLCTLRIAQQSPEGQFFWTLVDSHGTTFALVKGVPWKMLIHPSATEKEREHVVEDVVKLVSQLNADRIKSVA